MADKTQAEIVRERYDYDEGFIAKYGWPVGQEGMQILHEDVGVLLAALDGAEADKIVLELRLQTASVTQNETRQRAEKAEAELAKADDQNLRMRFEYGDKLSDERAKVAQLEAELEQAFRDGRNDAINSEDWYGFGTDDAAVAAWRERRGKV